MGGAIDDAELERVYGRWLSRTPAEAAVLLADYPGTWWIAGGWAIEAYTGVSRPHHDCDPSVLRAELPLLRRHLAGRLDVWAAGDGALRPLWPGELGDAAADEVLRPWEGQLWTRAGAESPWELDILLSPGSPEEWVYRRDESLRRPLSEALWERDGIRYLRPEIQLLYKAKGLRLQDQADLDACLPLLDRSSRAWLAAALRQTLPGHPWLAMLR